MRHHILEEADSYRIALLCKGSAFGKQEIISNYVKPLNTLGMETKEMIAFTLKYNETGKAPAKFIKEYLDSLLKALSSLGVGLLYVADSNYFKTLTGQARAEPHLGYVLPCKIKGYEHMKVVLGLNYQQLIYNPELQQKLTLSLTTLASQAKGNYQELGSGIIHSAQYPKTLKEIDTVLKKLHQFPSLTCDIEGFSLRFNEAGIGTIAFAWDEHNGVAFAVDYNPLPEPVNGMYGEYFNNVEVKRLLKKFFTEYKGKLIWHNSVYDTKVLIYELWMKTL